MPAKPIPEDDPIVSKSLAPHYLLAMLILMATLLWALWDEDFGQRPWKAFQQEWKGRYSEFLKRDFPRLPLTSDVDMFRELCAIGDKLVGLHLMERSTR